MELPSLVAWAPVTFLSYLFGLSIYRLYFSRISHIPGPKLAALTYYYQSYYDLWPHGGQFLFHCRDLHKRYGPIIRIGPDEIHIDDPNFYNEIYTSNARRRDKSTLWFWMVGTGNGMLDGASFATMGHDLHRLRRSAVNPFFSKRMVQELEPRVKSKVELLKKRVLGYAGTGELLDLCNACSGLTLGTLYPPISPSLHSRLTCLTQISFPSTPLASQQARSRCRTWAET